MLDGGVTRHGAWDAGMALLAARRDARGGTAATHGHEHDGCLRSSRARLVMHGLLLNGVAERAPPSS